MYYRFLLLFSLCVNAFGQSNIPIGTWRTHLSYKSVETVEVADDRIYAGSANNAFYLENGVFFGLSKLTGLSDVGVTKIRYHEKTKTVVFGYANGNIDLIIDKTNIVNINDIVRADIQGSKRINEIHFHENLAFLSTDFGVVVLDLVKKEIKETYQNFSVTSEVLRAYATVIHNDTIFVCTNKGLYKSKYSNTNLMDFSAWRRTSPTNIPTTTAAIGAAVFNDKVWVAFLGEGIFYKETDNWIQSAAGKASASVVFGMRVSNGRLIFCTPHFHYLDEQQLTFIPPLGDGYRDAVYDKNGQLLIADISSGLISITNEQFNTLTFNGPSTTSIFNFREINGDIYSLPGGWNSFYGPEGNNYGLDRFSKGVWEKQTVDPRALALVDIAYNSSNESYYFASYNNGLVIGSKNGTKILDSDNSDFINIAADANPPFKSIRISTLAVEEDGDVWVGNYSLPENPQLFKLDLENNFVKQIKLHDGIKTPMQIVFDNSQNLWIRSSTNVVSVFNEKTSTLVTFGIPVNQLNTNVNVIFNEKKGLKNASVNVLAVDAKGEIWVGTDEGIFVYNDPGLVFQANSPNFTTPYYAGFPLLYDKVIKAIKVDAANRKWIGTTSGVWLMNESGTEIVHYFNVENSPLLSNNIIDIEIEPTTGEVFIGTDKGIISYRSNATEVNKDGKFENVNVFPNPVKPGFSGNVAISGLAANETSVKITDIFGNMIFETKSTGGTATWNLKDYNGTKAKPGMYLIFNMTPDGAESLVSKVAIVD